MHKYVHLPLVLATALLLCCDDRAPSPGTDGPTPDAVTVDDIVLQ